MFGDISIALIVLIIYILGMAASAIAIPLGRKANKATTHVPHEKLMFLSIILFWFFFWPMLIYEWLFKKEVKKK